jgi:hypothetical protein
MLKHGKSKKAFEHNVKTEIESGKPQDQALAIAYSMKRRNQMQHKAEGGMINPKEHPREEEKEKTSSEDSMKKLENSIRKATGDKLNEGGSIGSEALELAKAVLAKHSQHLNSGGFAEQDGDYDHNLDDFLSHDDEQEAFPGDHSSNEIGMHAAEEEIEHDDKDEDRHRVIRNILSKIRSR